MGTVDKISYALLVLFLRLYELEPLPEEAWERREYGPHIIWTVPANVPVKQDVPGFYDQLSCSLWEYINNLRLNIKFQPYAVEQYGNAVVYVSIYQ